ncbi:MAG TPA: hypothetical protein VIS77_09790 [Burkholderiales bacterium]
MALKIAAGVLGIVLLLAFLAPPVIKLKDGALAVVCLIGVAMMLIDFWQSLKEKDE